MNNTIQDRSAEQDEYAPELEHFTPSPELATVMRRAGIDAEWFRPGAVLKYLGETAAAPIALACFSVDDFAQEVSFHLVERTADTRRSIRLALTASDAGICGLSAIPALEHRSRMVDVLDRICKGFRWAGANLPTVQ
jgi:hypothetical protein